MAGPFEELGSPGKGISRARGLLGGEGPIAIIYDDILRGVLTRSIESAVDAEDYSENAITTPPGERQLDDATRTRLVARALEALDRKLEEAGMNPELRTVAEVMEQVLPIVRQEHGALRDREVRQLAKAILELNRTQDPLVSSHQMIKENARQRALFLTNWPMHSSRAVTELAGHRAKNASATASRWKGRRAVFSVTTADGALFPAFQFVNGDPHPSIAVALEKLPKGMTDWSIAFWFTTPNAYLEGRLPVELLHDPDLLSEAAQYEAEALAG